MTRRFAGLVWIGILTSCSSANEEIESRASSDLALSSGAPQDRQLVEYSDVKTVGVASAIAAERDGSYYLAGTFDTVFDFGNGVVATPQPNTIDDTRQEIYIAKFDARGRARWVKTIHAVTPDSFANGDAYPLIKVRPDGGWIMFGGASYGSLDFGGMSSPGSTYV